MLRMLSFSLVALTLVVVSAEAWPEWGAPCDHASVALKRGGEDGGVLVALKRGSDDGGVLAPLKRGSDDGGLLG